ncbi:MAG: hypothetical protein ABWY58_14070 [Aeromicrobium sp.]
MWSPMYTISFVTSVLFQARTTREERGAAFTEYVVLVAAVVAVIVAIGFTDIGEALEAKISDIAGKINPAA